MPRLTVTSDGVAVDLMPDETILEGLYRHGFAYRIGCRRGGCAVCIVDLIDGDVVYTRPIDAKVLSDDQRSQGQCLSCRAVPVTDVSIALREDSLRRVNPLMARFAGDTTAG